MSGEAKGIIDAAPSIRSVANARDAHPRQERVVARVIPHGWRRIPIYDFAPLQRGFDLPTPRIRPGQYPVVYSNGILRHHANAMVKGPGVVTGRSGTIGKVHFVEDDYWPHNTALWVTSFRGNDPKFVYYLYTQIDFARFLSGSGVPTLNRNDVHLHVIAKPSLPEQRAISEALSDMEALLDTWESLIDKKRAIKRAAMQQLLTGRIRLPGFDGDWDMKRIREFASCTAGGTPSTLVPKNWGGSIRWMNSGDLHLKQVHDVEGRITENGLNNSSAKMLPAGSVLIGLAGQGKTRGTVATNLVPLCTNQSIAAILPNSTFVPEYLYHNLDSRYDELRDLSSGGGGRGGLNLTIIRSIAIPFPSVSEQRAIATVLSDMDAEIVALEARLNKARGLNQAMMQELLTGKTRLVGPEVANA